MAEQDWLAHQFEESRPHLRAVAYRMLGSLNEADDAVQEAWLRLSRSDAGEIQNLGGWLTTVVARVCLDMLRSRQSRREEPIEEESVAPRAAGVAPRDPEQEALLADSVGLALLVVLDRLSPAERLAFVLHDMFGTPFEEIARITGRTPVSVRQLASRARTRVRGAASVSSGDLPQQRKLVDEFLDAVRTRNMEGLLAVLDPDLVFHVDEFGGRPGAPREILGARAFAEGAVTFSASARFAEAALVDGAVGAILAASGRLARVLRVSIRNGKIAQLEVIADPARLRQIQVAPIPEAGQ